jgi:hypothetical protein
VVVSKTVHPNKSVEIGQILFDPSKSDDNYMIDEHEEDERISAPGEPLRKVDLQVYFGILFAIYIL